MSPYLVDGIENAMPAKAKAHSVSLFQLERSRIVNLEEMYSKMSPDQRSQLAQMIQQRMGGNVATQVDPNNPTPQQMADLHREVQQKNPGLLGEIRKHPLVAAGLGAVAAFELDKHFGRG